MGKITSDQNINRLKITKVCATIASLLSIEFHANANSPIIEVLEEAEKQFGAGDCDRFFMYNPDGIANWLYEAHKVDFTKLEARAQLAVPMKAPFPPYTPVCYASMYSGLEPADHGIQKNTSHMLSCRTIFDDMVRQRRKVAIIATEGESMARLFAGKEIDYFIYETKEECNRKALELISADKHEFIILYNGDYDHYMHKYSPEGERALQAMRENISTYNEIYDAISRNWKQHNTVLVFAPEHGCHKTKLGILGAHGKNIPEDTEIMHFYSFLPREQF